VLNGLVARYAAVAAIPLAGLIAGRRDVRLMPVGAEASEIRVGRLEAIGSGVQVQTAGKWKKSEDSAPLLTGQSIRTDEAGAAQLDMAWAVLVLGPSSSFRLLPSRVLTGVLDRGRIEQRASAVDIIRLRTPDAAIEGHGDVVVRRDNDVTAVSALSGKFRVETPEGGLDFTGGQGVLIPSGHAPGSAADLPPPATELYPSRDPLYVVEGQPAHLRWTSSTSHEHMQVFVEPGGTIVADTEVEGATFSITLPLGLYRWHVSTVSGPGLESPPSPDGLICVVEK
jgi:hypothetical protein